LFAADEEMEDRAPFPQLATSELAEDAHLQLLKEVQDFGAKLERNDHFSGLPADNSSRALSPFEGRHGVCEDLYDLQDLLQKDPLDKEKVLRRIRQLLPYWAVMFPEPHSIGMEQLIIDLKSMEGRLTSDASTSTEVGFAIEEGHNFSDRLDDASSTVEDMLTRGAEQRASEEKEDEALEAQLLAAEKGAEQLLARAAKATATAKMIRKEQAARSLCRDLRRQNTDMQEARLRQLKECHQKLELQLKRIEQVGDPLSRSIANILAYKFA
jgi:hypothetical protein